MQEKKGKKKGRKESSPIRIWHDIRIILLMLKIDRRKCHYVHDLNLILSDIQHTVVR